VGDPAGTAWSSVPRLPHARRGLSWHQAPPAGSNARRFLAAGFGWEPVRVHPWPSLTQTGTQELGSAAVAPARLRRSGAGFLAPIRSLH
jgi:hypothetical protein